MNQCVCPRPLPSEFPFPSSFGHRVVFFTIKYYILYLKLHWTFVQLENLFDLYHRVVSVIIYFGYWL